MTESESDPFNSTVNPRGNIRMCIPPKRAGSNPNISGFIDESLYTGPGRRLQSQREIRTEKILNTFHRLQMNINEWDLSIKNNFPSSFVEINQ